MLLLLLASQTNLLAAGRDPQIIAVSANETVQGVISLKEPSRIAVESGRIRAFDHRGGAVEIKRDKFTGEIRVVPPENDRSPINLFITTERGDTYTLLLSVTDVPAQTVILRDAVYTKSNTKQNTGPKVLVSREHETSLLNLVTALARGSSPSYVDVVPKNVEYRLWQEGKFVLINSWLAKSMVADRFMLTNVSNDVMRVTEAEFFKQGVYAVGVDAHELTPGSRTYIYIVRERAENE